MFAGYGSPTAMTKTVSFFISLGILVGGSAFAQQSPSGLAKPGTAKVADAMVLPEPKDVKLGGLLGYYQYTGNKEALAGARKVGDLLCKTFGPGKKSIISAGTHVGMASTSVLEPVVLLYRATADKKYLDFANYIVSAWEEPNGPH